MVETMGGGALSAGAAFLLYLFERGYLYPCGVPDAW